VKGPVFLSMTDEVVFREIFNCRLCGSHTLAPVIDLGQQSLTGRFPKAGEGEPPSAPLTLVRCEGCGLVQLKHSVSVREMFGEGYGYRSGMNATMRNHLNAIARRIADLAGLQAGDAVLDIGCNDGTLLTSYQTTGLHRIGIDPIADNFRKEYPATLTVHSGFFDAASFRSISGRATARAVSSVSMFYDLEDPGAFVANIASVLAPDGIWVLEQSYLPSMLEQNSFDTICHEHLEYYGLEQIERLLREHGLRVFDVSLNHINGGSFQVWVCHEGSDRKSNQQAVESLKQREVELALRSDRPFAAFRERVTAIGVRLKSFIGEASASGKRVYGYGASTKGNVLLQHFGLDRALLRGCADKNPAKWGCRTPGTQIPIVSEDEARADADYFLVLPWHFREEFILRETEFRSRGGKFIFPLPNVEIV
jgi:SAM-dependent methyltransferase